MTDINGRRAIEFDHNSPEHAEDPAGDYERLRESCPIGWTAAHGGFWVMSDYASVFEAARDDGIFSSRRTNWGGEGLSVLIPKTPSPIHIPIELDPPEFRPFRRIVNDVASPKAVAALAPLINRFVTEFIDDVIEAGECDFASVVGVPAVITVAWLGLPLKDWQRYASAHHAVVAQVKGSQGYIEATEVDFPYLHDVTRRVIAERRAQPADDLISYFVTQEVGGRPITDDEVFGIVDLLLAGGVDTTASLVGQTLVWLDDHHTERSRLVAEPALLTRAMEEFLRYFAPAPALARTVTKDAEFRGCPMKEGDRVLLSWLSANRDDTQFDEPDRLDIDRWPNRHLSFGIGIHRCVGSHLGRAMAQELVGQVLRRMPDYRIERTRLRKFPQQGSSTGYAAIPATFSSGVREGEIKGGSRHVAATQ